MAVSQLPQFIHPLPEHYPFWADTYTTHHDARETRIPKALPTPFFYENMFRIVWKSSKLAQKGLFTTPLWIGASYGIVKALEKVGGNFRIEGLENVQTLKTPCVFIGNHMSTLETFVLPCLIAPLRDVTFVVKQELVDMPVFGPIMRSRDPIVVKRKNPRDDLATVLKEGALRLASNTSVVVFPQSTRSTRLDPQIFNTIGIKLAKRAGVPVIPVALKTDAWGMGKIVKDFGRISPRKTVHFRFGPPVTVTGNGKAEHEAVYSFIKTSLDEWEQRDEAPKS